MQEWLQRNLRLTRTVGFTLGRSLLNVNGQGQLYHFSMMVVCSQGDDQQVNQKADY